MVDDNLCSNSPDPLAIPQLPLKRSSACLGWTYAQMATLRFAWRPLPKVRHDPLHELVKQWHRKGGFSMSRTVDQAFGNQLVSYRGYAGYALAEPLRNVTRAMGPLTEGRHGTQIALFGGSQSV